MATTVLETGRLRDSWLLAQLLDLGPKLLLGIAIALPLELSLKEGILYSLGRSPTLAFFMAGSVVIHAWTKPGWRELLGAIVCGATLGGLHTWILGGAGESVLVMAASFLGVGSLAVLAIRALQTRGEQQRAKFFTLLASGVFPFIWIVTAYAVHLTTSLYPNTYDLYLDAFDGSLGFQPSFWMGQVFSRHSTLAQISGMVYLALPLEVAFLYAWRRMNTRRLPVNVLMLFLTTSLFGAQLYYFLPATGPLYAFGKAFPWNPPDLAALLIEPLRIQSETPRNAMPSLHAAAALLVFWNSIAWPKWARAATAIFLLFTLLATLGYGEHYLVDLVVSVPLSLALQACWTTSLPGGAPERRSAIIAGCLAVAAWLVLLRIGTPLFAQSPWVGWIAIAVTIIPCLLLQRRLRTAMMNKAKIYSTAVIGME
jgi:PAP2 superfamily